MKCKNCNQSLESENNYCPNCGQKNISVLNMKFILGEFFQSMFNIDSKFFQTLKYLIFKPGFLTKEYIEGKRLSYLPPIRIYLVLSFLFFFLISIFDFEEESNSEPYSSEKQENTIKNVSETDSDDAIFSIEGFKSKDLKRMQYEGTLEQGLDSLTGHLPIFEAYVVRKLAMAQINDKGFVDVLRDQFSLFLMLFLPFFALMYGLLFRKSKKGFVGHLIFNLHLNSFIIFALLIDLTLSSIMGNNEVVNFIWEAINLLYIQYYIIKAIMVFYERKWWAALSKYFLLLVGYGLLAFIFLVVVFFSSIMVL